MNPATPLPSIFDTQSLAGLKGGLRKDDPQALKAAAQQFEAIFLQMMLKSMRAATPQESMFDSDQTRFYQELLDSQLSQVMAAQGGTGLAAVIERQLRGSQGGEGTATAQDGFPLYPPERPYSLPSNQRSLPLLTPRHDSAFPLQGSPVQPRQSAAPLSTEVRASNFTATLWPHAVEAGNRTGIPPQFLLAHAALESGWGRSEPRFADGQASYNLFGIKAGAGWQGPTVETSTTEFVNGVAERRTERFRAYASYAEAFEDYARLLTQSPRYAGALGTTDSRRFAQTLQQGGYATDPAYARKLEQVINGDTLRASLAALS